jgi:glutathione S-transferase
LAARTWLVGNARSYAGFRVATALPWSQQAGLPLDEFPHVDRWYRQLLEIAASRTSYDDS